tara:strand:+ start:297 stop:467 length:171 start_codon:yes stop_codon:yes gene_type:complete
LTYGGYPLKSSSPLFGDASELAAHSQVFGFKIIAILFFFFLIKRLENLCAFMLLEK